jgi:hypothetical protein
MIRVIFSVFIVLCLSTTLQSVDVGTVSGFAGAGVAAQACPKVCQSKNYVWSGHFSTRPRSPVPCADGPGMCSSVCGCVPSSASPQPVQSEALKQAPVTPPEKPRPSIHDPKNWNVSPDFKF